MAKKVTSYDALLTGNQKAQVYLSCARLFYPMDDTKSRHPDYEYYLRKAVDCCSDYEIIADCDRYLSVLKQNNSERSLKSAYKRVIEKAKKNKDYNSIYSAASKLKEIYEKEATREIGYVSMGYKNGEQFDNACKYQELAIMADKKINGKLSLSELKELSRLYRSSKNISKWVENQQKIAGVLKGKDRYKFLISILPDIPTDKKEYVVSVLNNLSKERMKVSDKKIVLNMIEERCKSFCKQDDINNHISNIKTSLNAVPIMKTNKTKGKQ